MPTRERIAVRNLGWLDKALVVFIIALLVFILILYWPHFTKHQTAQQAVTAAPVIVQAVESAPLPTTLPMNEVASVIPASANNLLLSGVLVSDNEKLALINKKMYHIGDNVEGLKILSIDINTVQLQDDHGRMVTLRTAS
jgi:archaellum component FlaF (FlaF/FlaG flagellin family)